jgi:hypothetical protein
LGRDDAAESMPVGKHDAAVIDFGLGAGCALKSVIDRALDQRSATGWAPVGLSLSGEYGVALRADAFHQL